MSTDAAYVRGLSPEDYLEHTQVGVFLEDMTLQVLARRAERPVEFMAQYAREAASMALPVVGRGWAFIRSTTKSRRCFAAAAYDTLRKLAASQVTPADAHQVLALMCTDLPPSMVNGAAERLPRDVFTGDAQLCLPCGTLAIALAIFLCHDEFLARLEARLVASSNGGSGLTLAAVRAELAAMHTELVWRRSGIRTSVVEAAATAAGLGELQAFDVADLVGCVLRSDAVFDSLNLGTRASSQRISAAVAATAAPPSPPSASTAGGAAGEAGAR